MSFPGSFYRAGSAFLYLRQLGVWSVLLGIVTTLVVFGISSLPASAAPGINKTINFQGRLLNSQGATVADGYYNIQFKIYQDGTGTAAGNPSGTLKWTETYVNNNAQAGVLVKNGFLSVNLGTNNAFGSSVDWNQDTLWLSMNVAGSDNTCTSFGSAPCAADGEMLPMKRMTATPYSLNSGALNGLTSSNFVQLAQGVQTDASTNTSSIFINKTSTGNLLQLQNAGTDAFTLNNTGDIVFGSNADHSLTVATAPASTAGRSMTLTGGAAGTGGAALAGGNLVLQGGAGGGTNGNGGDLLLDAGAKNGSGNDGNISIGTSRASTIQIGNSALASGTQTINIGNNNTAGGTTNVTIGTGGSATGGTTTIQSKGNTTINTNGIARATFDTSGNLYVGNGTTNSAPSNFTIQGTTSTTTAVSGGALTIQGGGANTGNANGGNLTLSGGTGVGTGVNGLVVINTATYSAATVQNSAVNVNVTQSNIDSFGSILLNATASNVNFTLSAPSLGANAAGRLIYVTAANGSSDFTLRANVGAGTGVEQNIAMRQNTTATMIWNGSQWTAAGASSSTTLQAAYDNTLTSAGGAELLLSNGANANGLTIRDSSTNPVNGTLLEVQNSAAATLFSVNSNVTEYASNAGAESTFSASNWVALGSSTVTRNTTASFVATGQGSASVATTTAANDGVKNVLSTTLTASQHYNVSFSAKLASGTFTDLGVYFSINGSTNSVTCTTGQAVKTSVWTKINCAFTAPSSGITSSNSINIRQVGSGTARTVYIDNLSVTIAADFNYVSDGGADTSGGTFSAIWDKATFGGSPTGTVDQWTSDGQAASTSAKYTTVPNTAKVGIRNKLAINPLPNTLYRVTVYAKSSTAMSDFMVRYTPTAATANTSSDGNYVDCVDYNTRSITTSSWTKVTCYIATGATTPDTSYLYFVQQAAPGATRDILVDTASLTLSTSSTPNVQIGGGVNGGPTTLFTLDKGASAPIAGDNEALLGSMYYDTTLGKLQCYEADGWGACGSSPDNVVTISPEYTNAVMHGTGVGTMTSDFCSDLLNINDPTNSPQICGTNETFNFYKWTSPQATAQTYSIYVTYQLPSTFNTFTSGSTSLQGKTDSSNATVQYRIYKNNGSGLTQCGSSAVSVSTGVQTSWQTGTASGAVDPSTCSFAGGNSVVFKIDVTASSNANAYVGNLNFTFSNK